MTTPEAKEATVKLFDPAIPHCPICGHSAEAPAKRILDGKIVECCVAACHDAHIVWPSNHSAFVARARKQGIRGFDSYGVGKALVTA